MYTYLILNIITIAVPLARSFEHRIAFYRKFGSLFTAIFVTGAFFLVWDYLFTTLGIWRFNEDYLLGIYFFQLPLEEWLFFLTVPFACIFIYEVLKYFVRNNFLKPFSKYITILLIIILATAGAIHIDKLYTAVTFLATAAFLGIQLLLRSKYMSWFYLTYLVSLIPFFIINGFLTALPVVIYNNSENLGIRLFTIPLEDTIYSMLLLLMNITIYEHINKYIFKKEIGS